MRRTVAGGLVCARGSGRSFGPDVPGADAMRLEVFPDYSLFLSGGATVLRAPKWSLAPASDAKRLAIADCLCPIASFDDHVFNA